MVLFLCGAKSVTYKDGKYYTLIVDVDGDFYRLPKTDCKNIFGEGVCYNLRGFIDKIAKKTYIAPENAKFCRQNGEITIVEEKNGRKIDVSRLEEDIKNCLSVGGGYVSAKIITLYPSYKREDLENKNLLRANFSTDYSGSSKERENNVKLATKAVSGITVYPDEVFSFNDIVGVRSKEFGYENAKVIVDGKYVDGVGGGVCQVSTTLYNTALLANLTVTEYHRHTLAVGYVEKSFDAMVSYGYADLKIKNTTGFPIFIEGLAENGVVTFNIYGNYQTEKVERESVLIKVIKPNVTTVFSDLLPSGESKFSVIPKNGYESEGYLLISDGDFTKRLFLRKDEYKKIDGIIEVGK